MGPCGGQNGHIQLESDARYSTTKRIAECTLQSNMCVVQDIFEAPSYPTFARFWVYFLAG